MELIKVGILGWSGFLGARLSNDLKYKFKIIKIKKSFKNTRYQDLDTIICCAGPNKFWCFKNKISIEDETQKLSRNIINYSKKNKVKKIVYFSSIHVLKKTKVKELKPYIKWHKYMEKNLLQSKFKILIIRLPNLFGRPKKTRKDFWNFFVNLTIKKSLTNKKLIIKNNPETKIYAYPLNFFVEFLIKNIKKKYKKKITTINLNKNFYFPTFQLIFMIKEILSRKNISLKDEFKKNKVKENKLNNLKTSEKKFFEEEIINLIKFGKKIFNER